MDELRVELPLKIQEHIGSLQPNRAVAEQIEGYPHRLLLSRLERQFHKLPFLLIVVPKDQMMLIRNDVDDTLQKDILAVHIALDAYEHAIQGNDAVRFVALTEEFEVSGAVVRMVAEFLDEFAFQRRYAFLFLAG